MKTKHGGKREGAGRKSSYSEETQYALCLMAIAFSLC